MAVLAEASVVAPPSRRDHRNVLTDPKVYTTPIQITATLRHRPDLQLLEYTCTDALWDEYLAERGLTLPDVDSFPNPQGAQ